MAAPIRVGIIGAGVMGATHSTAYKTLKNVDVVAVASERRPNAERIANDHDAEIYRTWESLLEEAHVDVIDICLPTFLHAEVAIAAMKRGRHVVCEKPIALTTTESGRMLKAAADNRACFMVAQVLRFWPEYQALEQLRSKKKLGALQSFIARRTGGAPQWTWRNWAQDPARSGGAALDLHIHDVDYILHLFGPPRSVLAIGRGDPPGSVEISTTFLYDNGIAAQAHAAWHPAPDCPFEMAFSAGFEKGVVNYSSLGEPTLWACPSRGERYYPSLPKARGLVSQAGGNIAAVLPYANELEYFVSCIRSGKEPVKCPPEESQLALKTVHAALKSIKSGRPVSLQAG